MSTLFIIGCFKKPIKIENTKSFSLNYSVGYHMNGDYTYEVILENDKYIASYKKYCVDPEDALKKEVDIEFVHKIEELMTKYQVNKWDGFNKSDKDVLDGNSFSFSYSSTDNKSIEAHGYMKWPKNYREFRDEISDLYEKEFENEKTTQNE